MNKKENQQLDKYLKLIIKSCFIVFIGIFLSKILIYVYRIIIARYFGAEVYGLFSLSIMIMSLFLAFSSLGLTEGLLRYIAIYRGKKQINKIRYTLKKSLIILVFLGIFSGLVLFFSAELISLKIFHELGLIIFLKVLSFFIPFSVIAGVFIYTLRAFEKIQSYSFLHMVLGNLTKTVMLIFLIVLGFKSNAVIISYIAGIFAVFIGAYFICKYKLPEIFTADNLGKKTKKKIMKELFSYSWPLMFFAFILGIFGWIDSFAIGYFKTVKDVGFYNAAVPIAFLFDFIPNLFVQLFLPLINKEFARKNFEIISRLSKQIVKWILILNLPLFIIILLFPGAIINILFGKEYLIATNPLRILSIGVFFYSLFIISNNLLSMAGKSKLILFNLVIASIVNITFNIILVPIYGLNGAAISTAISFIILSFMVFFEVKYYTSIIPFRKKFSRILLMAIIPTIGLIYFKQFIKINLITLIAVGFLFLLSYTFLIIATGCLDGRDLMILKSIKKKILNR